MTPRSPLINVGRLKELVDDGTRVTILDVRWSLGGPPERSDFLAGHVPGAVFVDLDADLAAPPGAGGRHPLPEPDPFGSAMRAVGVCRQQPVVVYDGRDGTSAARAWWLLRHHGHRDVRLLDGGLAAWVAAGGALSIGESPPTPGDFAATAGGMAVLDAEAAGALASAGVLLDARDLTRYTGEHEPVDPVAGHIPYALSAPTRDNVDADGRFHSPDSLRRRFSQLGVDPGAHVGTYCGSGVTAAHQVLALELAGISAALYAGSWSHWITDPRRPVARGRR